MVVVTNIEADHLTTTASENTRHLREFMICLIRKKLLLSTVIIPITLSLLSQMVGNAVTYGFDLLRFCLQTGGEKVVN